MKKVFLLLTMLLFAFTGTMKAQSLTVHDGTASNSYVPVYGYYADAYQKCEMVYPATELGEMTGGTINGLTFYASQTSVDWGCDFQVFVTEVDDATISSFAGPGTVVYEGALSIADGTMDVTFDTPYVYNGSNLLVGVYVTATGTYLSSTWYGEAITGATVQGYSYTSLDAITATQRNFLPKTTFNYVSGGASSITTNPAVLDLGYRPNNAWTAPFMVNVENAGAAVTVNALDLSGTYFTYNAELPATVYSGNPLEVELVPGTAEEGLVESTMTILYSGNRDAEQFNVSAIAYNPVENDVYELATEVTSFPYQANAATDNLYKNYDLPGINENAKDAVYKVTFDTPVMFSAGTAGSDPTTYMYKEDFNGEGGPRATNYYEYDGPEVNPGPTMMWFYYDYTNGTTFNGSTSQPQEIFGYKIPAEYLQELGLGNCAITTVEARSYAGTYYDLVILQGGDQPDLDNIVYYQEFTDFTQGDWFDIVLDEPLFLGDQENIWIMLFSDSNYAAYTGKDPIDSNAGNWYSYDLTTWSYNAARTPLIYTLFLELPTGREVTVNPKDFSMREAVATTGEINQGEVAAENIGASRAQEYIARHQNNNRGSVELLNEGFEGGTMPTGWSTTSTYWAVTSGTGHSSWTGAATGSYDAGCYISNYNSSDILITPAMDLSNASSANLTFNFKNTSWGGDINTLNVYYRVNGGEWNLLYTNGNEVASWTGVEVQLSGLAAQYQIGFECVSGYSYGMGIDDVVVTAEEGEQPDPVYQISDMFVPAGTYYVAVASTQDNFQVDMAVTEVPAPEPSFVMYPYDGQTNVTAPVVAQWVLGDYTEEMQVLFGTQYPPTDVLIDWTDELVAGALVTELEPNQSYFIQVNTRNVVGTTMGEIVAFTTPIDGVEGFAVEEDNLYPGDAAVFTWEANRSFKGYNLYKDGVKVNEDLITENTYTVEGLEYNMNGYSFAVTAVYDAGESMPSDEVVVYMTGNGTVNGTVYDTDELMPIAMATIEFRGTDEYGVEQVIPAIADMDGVYTCEVLAGSFVPYVVMEGYAEIGYDGTVNVEFEGVYDDINIYTHEFYYPLSQITATEQEDNTVLVEWSWDPASLVVDFETGDFSQAEFTLPTTYPWAITTTNPHEGTYCMKSTCEGVASGVSSIEATVEVPFDAKMGFWVKVSTETNYDKFHFYIDGVEQGAALSGNLDYQYKEFAVAEGTHTYKWEYAKDSSVNSNDDCVYVDDITMYRKDEPLPPTPGVSSYDFEDQTMMSWTSIDADGDGYGWVSSGDPGQYHNAGVSLAGTGHNASQGYVISGSYTNPTQTALTPDNYLVSPTQISAQDGAAISFYASAQDANYAAEHFGVAVSTTGNTSGNDFTTIQEWTLTAKNALDIDANSAIRGITAQGSWYEYTADLSAYAGQDIWVAIRHFNCTDQFILNIDDIAINDGSAKGVVRNNRSLQSYNLYRRNNIVNETPELIAEGLAADVLEYTDAEWETLPYGEWQWGIQATYEGYAPVPERSRETATFGFEGGSLDGWTNIKVNTDGGEWLNSNYNLGGYDYTALAHTGTGFAMCYSFVDYDGPYDTDAYFVSPQKYSVDANSSIAFWADNANDNYPENFSVCVSTAENPTATDFVQIWSGGAKGTGSNGATVRRAENRYENWRSHEISLAAYAGQEIWIAFHDVNYDAYEIWIDDVTITYAGSAPVPPTPPVPTGSGLSEILWSNVIEKDMISEVVINVELNNAQLPTGAQISMVGSETYNATVDETGVVELEVRKGMYDITVTLEDYEDYVESVMIDEDNETINIVLIELINPVSDFAVSPTGWAMWGGGSVGPIPPTPPTPVTEVTYGFEASEEGWTSIDADGDGYEWTNLNPTNNPNNIPGHNNSVGHMTSASYAGSALTPDNYLVSPEKAEYSQIRFWACGQDASWAAEHFGVAVSTTGNTSASDFLTIEEWTMTAKDQGNWYEYTADLSAYAGQEIWVAIRHFDVTDMFRLNVDDITLTTNSAKGTRSALVYKVKLDGEFVGETIYPFFQLPVEGIEEGSEHLVQVAPLYATGMGAWTSATWIYSPCSNYAGLTEYDATVSGTDVTLTWQYGGQPVPPTPPTPPTGDVTITLTADDVWGDGSGYQMLLDDTHSLYGTTIPETGALSMNCSGNEAIYAQFSHKIPTNADGNCTTQNMVNNNSVSITVPAGTYDWCITNPTPGDRIWIASSNGTIGGRYDDYTFESGYTYEFHVYFGGANDATDLTISPAKSAQPKMAVASNDNKSIENVSVSRGNRDMWDYVFSFSGTSAGQQAVATDGEFIYTASWQSSPAGGYTFYKYELDGTFVEGFNIAGATGIRDLTFDGDYFYGSSGGAQIFCLDLTNKTLVSTINCSGLTSRHLSYDPVRDGFWSGNWTTLALYDRTGALVQSAAAPVSAYGSAYYKDADDVEHLFLFCQPNSDAKVFDYNIGTNTISANPVLDFSTTPAFDAGIAGGCFIGTYDNKTCWFGNAQQDPNLIGIYELSSSTPVPPVPPTPSEILGVMIWRDGEPLSMTPLAGNTFVDEDVEAGEHDYCIRVVYSDYAMSCEECEEVTVGDTPSCDPVINLNGYYMNYQGQEGIVIDWEDPEGAVSIKLYEGTALLGSVPVGQHPIFLSFEGQVPAGTITIGAVAVYADCESDMVSVDVYYDNVIENEVVNEIYPNPTSADLHINATAMTHVSVFNAMGQMVLDQEVSGDEVILNMGQFESGVYMVKVTTETGSSVKRINVVK